MRWIRRFFGQSIRRQGLLLRAALQLMAARGQLAIDPAWALRVGGASAVSREPRREAVLPVEAARDLLAVARFLPFSTTCLDRSLALFRLLRSEGIPSSMRIGVARHGSRSVIAHAWVEHEGRVLLDDGVSGFTPFDHSVVSSEAGR